MPFYFFIWDGKNDRHVAEHGVTCDEFEEVASDPVRIERSHSSDEIIVFGETSTGKHLACVYVLLDMATIYPVTAYEVER